MADDRRLRVFIGSTFRDMHAQRDWLVRFVFPELREVMLKPRIHLLDVARRWGVPSNPDVSEVCPKLKGHPPCFYPDFLIESTIVRHS